MLVVAACGGGHRLGHVLAHLVLHSAAVLGYSGATDLVWHVRAGLHRDIQHKLGNRRVQCNSIYWILYLVWDLGTFSVGLILAVGVGHLYSSVMQSESSPMRGTCLTIGLHS